MIVALHAPPDRDMLATTHRSPELPRKDPKMRYLQATILTVAVALTVAACSGSSTPTPAGAPTASPPAAVSGGPTTGAPAAGASDVTIADFAFAPAWITVYRRHHGHLDQQRQHWPHRHGR